MRPAAVDVSTPWSSTTRAINVWATSPDSRCWDGPADGVAAEDVEDHVEVEVRPRRRALKLGDVPRVHLVGTLGEQALKRLTVVIDDPAGVARLLVEGIAAVRDYRKQNSDSYNFNWLLSIQPAFQRPFEVTHAAMRALDLNRAQPAHELAANLRRAFSGIVTGNVKEIGIQAIEREGPYELAGDPAVMRLIDELLAAFVTQRRMRLPGSAYRPVYRLVA